MNYSVIEPQQMAEIIDYLVTGRHYSTDGYIENIHNAANWLTKERHNIEDYQDKDDVVGILCLWLVQLKFGSELYHEDNLVKNIIDKFIASIEQEKCMQKRILYSKIEINNRKIFVPIINLQYYDFSNIEILATHLSFLAAQIEYNLGDVDQNNFDKKFYAMGKIIFKNNQFDDIDKCVYLLKYCWSYNKQINSNKFAGVLDSSFEKLFSELIPHVVANVDNYLQFVAWRKPNDRCKKDINEWPHTYQRMHPWNDCEWRMMLLVLSRLLGVLKNQNIGDDQCIQLLNNIKCRFINKSTAYKTIPKEIEKVFADLDDQHKIIFGHRNNCGVGYFETGEEFEKNAPPLPEKDVNAEAINKLKHQREYDILSHVYSNCKCKPFFSYFFSVLDSFACGFKFYPKYWHFKFTKTLETAKIISIPNAKFLLNDHEPIDRIEEGKLLDSIVGEISSLNKILKQMISSTSLSAEALYNELIELRAKNAKINRDQLKFYDHNNNIITTNYLWRSFLDNICKIPACNQDRREHPKDVDLKDPNFLHLLKNLNDLEDRGIKIIDWRIYRYIDYKKLSNIDVFNMAFLALVLLDREEQLENLLVTNKEMEGCFR